MTYDESTDILAIIYAYYSSNFNNLSETNACAIAVSWSIAFKDVPVEIMYITTMKWIDTKKFPPKICEMKNIITCDLYHEADDAITKHKKYNNLTEKALVKYQYVYDVTNRMRCNRRNLELSDFINNDGDFILYGNSVNDRLLE